MKLFSICTAQTTTLRDKWFLKMLQDDWELNIVQLQDAPAGNGDYLSPEWYFCIHKKIEVLINAIKENGNGIIIWADIDTQFFRPCTGIIEQAIQGNDIVFQMWHKNSTEVNTGFMAIRCNEKTLAFFKAASKVPFKGRDFADQDVINDLLKQGFPPVQWGLFPKDIYQVMLGLVPRTIALHHACATAEPYYKNGRKISTMELKYEQLTLIRQFAEYSLLERTIARLTALLKRAKNHVTLRLSARK